MRPSQEMKHIARDERSLFLLGVDRHNIYGANAYTMPYPGKDIPPCWEAYRKGIRAAQFGWNYDLKELKDGR